MQTTKLLFTGPMGAGKTTAIQLISEVTAVKTEVANLDRRQHNKATTTVALDYGELTLDDGAKVLMYGTPGQDRFNFMWTILAQGALGAVVLLDNSRPDPLADMNNFLDGFPDLVARRALVIGVGRTESHHRPSIESYTQALQDRGLLLPIYAVDVRERDDVLLLIDSLLSLAEA
jgi:uncharacterized protein